MTNLFYDTRNPYMKRVFLIVLDSFGIGEMPDAAAFGDAGSNTLAAAAKGAGFSMPNMGELGLFRIDGVDSKIENKGNRKNDLAKAHNEVVSGSEAAKNIKGAYARLTERSQGKDTTTGHWEIAGLISEQPMPVFPNGFPEELISEFSKRTGRGVLCNLPYSGTEVIKEYGEEHQKAGDLIVYTSADSVFQIAAHEDVVSVETLYKYCRIARELCQGPWGVGRVIARPFIGEPGNYTRTSRRHDFSLMPPKDTMLDAILHAGGQVLAVGKIKDIFAGKGIGEYVYTSGNAEGIDRTLEYMDRDFEGICFTNLVDFDMLYGHRNDVDGYAKALTYFDSRLPEILAKLGPEDLLMITADHGCDPSTASTDHSREYVPLVIAGQPVKPGVNLGTRESFADIGATVLDYLGISGSIEGKSFLKEITKQQK